MPSSTTLNFRSTHRTTSTLAAGLVCALALCATAHASQVAGTGIGAVTSSGPTKQPVRKAPAPASKGSAASAAHK